MLAGAESRGPTLFDLRTGGWVGSDREAMGTSRRRVTLPRWSLPSQDADR